MFLILLKNDLVHIVSIERSPTSWFSRLRFVDLLREMVVAPDHHEHSRYEKQGSDRSQNQSTDNSSTERRILFAAFSQAQCHRNHTDNHREGGHDHRS